MPNHIYKNASLDQRNLKKVDKNRTRPMLKLFSSQKLEHSNENCVSVVFRYFVCFYMFFLFFSFQFFFLFLMCLCRFAHKSYCSKRHYNSRHQLSFIIVNK
jgi:hypothetical protein